MIKCTAAMKFCRSCKRLLFGLTCVFCIGAAVAGNDADAGTYQDGLDASAKMMTAVSSATGGSVVTIDSGLAYIETSQAEIADFHRQYPGLVTDVRSGSPVYSIVIISSPEANED